MLLIKETMHASLVELAGKAWTAHQKDFMPPVTQLLWKPTEQAELQPCAYTIRLDKGENTTTCITVSISNNTEWTTHFLIEREEWPQGATTAVKIFDTKHFTPSQMTSATMEDLQHCETVLQTLVKPKK